MLYIVVVEVVHFAAVSVCIWLCILLYVFKQTLQLLYCFVILPR